MRKNTVPQNWQFAELLRRLHTNGLSGQWDGGAFPLGLALLAAGPLLFASGLLSGGQGLGFILPGWVLVTVKPSRAGRGIPVWKPVLRHSLDTALLFGAGLACTFGRGLPQSIIGLAAGAALTCYLAYYSGAAFLKSVPAAVRTANPSAMVELDHLFLARGTLWGAERPLVFFTAALGLLCGRPDWGFAAAIVAGNLYWIGRSWSFWKKQA